MTNLVEVADVVIDIDEVISIADSVEVIRSTWYCAYSRKCVSIIFKNKVECKYYNFTKADLLKAIAKVESEK